MPIHQLSVQLANQIAAGEVVERPSSVVKELLENAVDAGAHKIVLEVEGAGRLAVVVRDDGVGIAREELALALAPHATSKISTLEDLDAIATLGFRGEALASIASVSKLTLTSKPATQEDAFAVHTEGPAMEPVIVPAAHPNGTSVEVRELFFNTPARRRFLRSDRTEFMRIKDIWLRTALAHSDIAFELYQDGKLVHTIPAVDVTDNAGQRRRFAKLIGGQFVREAVDLAIKTPSLELSGLLLPPPPEYASVPENIYLFLNGRPLSDKLLTHALREAYTEVNGSRAAVRALLFLRCDPHAVDVNVHPRKDEVRFHEARVVHDCLVDAVVSTFRGQKMPAREEEHLPPPSLSPTQIANFNSMSAEIGQARSYAAQAGSQAKFNALINKMKQAPTPPTPPKEPAATPLFDPATLAPTQEVARTASTISRSLEQSKTKAQVGASTSNSAPVPTPVNSGSNLLAAAAVGDGAQLLDSPLPGVWLLKLRGRYFLVKTLTLQQALYAQDLMAKVAAGPLPAVSLTLPFTLRTDGALIRALKQCPQALERMGFKLKLKRESLDLLAIPQELKGSELVGNAGRALHLTAAGAKSISNGQCPQQLAQLLASCVTFLPLTSKAESAALLSKITDVTALAAMAGVSELMIDKWAHDLLGGA
ncbi:MAG: DNA mismatch repair endonuclease MutL [Candidatus Anaerobiospirillum merdipullorum]|uniref:DNA mismatch repair protein MutL n=1 Tax=Candidatus Anaerobiospirillum merdipullorum TaxID=2838450 RepID=A0A9E2KM40_9GAMM|nr:DNA mismatch repair endonuclease MutL [Candidatus Anaerobiospirillum merdipullorum]